MFALKIAQNLFEECSPDKISDVTETRKEDSVFRTLSIDISGVKKVITVEQRQYPFFYKYELYLDKKWDQPIDFKSKEGILVLLGFYNTYHPEYLKSAVYEEGKALADYFYTEKVPGEAMQHFVPGKGAVKEEEPGKPAMSYLEGYHEFTEEEKQDIGGQLDALKSQFADQLKELEGLLKK